MTINWYKPSQCVLILVTISSILAFFGCLVCGFLLHFAPEEPSEDINGGIYTSVPTIILLCASILVVIALVFGCYGACRDSKVALQLFSLLTVVVAALVVGSATAVFTFAMNETIHDKLSTKMFDELVQYSDENGSSNLYSTIQTDFKCCGVNNYTDWLDKNTTWSKERDNDTEIAPISCCVKNITNCNMDERNLQTQGCLDVVLSRMKIVIYSVLGFAIALAIFQFVTALFAYYGAHLIRRYQSYYVL